MLRDNDKYDPLETKYQLTIIVKKLPSIKNQKPITNQTITEIKKPIEIDSNITF